MNVFQYFNIVNAKKPRREILLKKCDNLPSPLKRAYPNVDIFKSLTQYIFLTRTLSLFLGGGTLPVCFYSFRSHFNNPKISFNIFQRFRYFRQNTSFIENPNFLECKEHTMPIDAEPIQTANFDPKSETKPDLKPDSKPEMQPDSKPEIPKKIQSGLLCTCNTEKCNNFASKQLFGNGNNNNNNVNLKKTFLILFLAAFVAKINH